MAGTAGDDTVGTPGRGPTGVAARSGGLPAPSGPRLVAAWWRALAPPQRLTTAAGLLLVGVGLAHLMAYAAVGGAWQGPVSLRKPVTFGLSFGLTCLTLGWFTSLVRISPRTAGVLAVALAGSTTAEVVWVSVQAWRGVPSHFNVATALDAALFNWLGGVSIAITVAVIVALTVLAWMRPAAPPSMVLALRVGLVLLLISQAVGAAMIAQGLRTQAAGGAASTTWGAGGAMKLAHFAGMHGVQLLPGLAWLLGSAAVPERTRRRLVAAAAGGLSALVAGAALQVFSGRAPTQPGLADAALLLLGAVLLGAAAAGAAAVRHARGAVPADS